MSNRFLGNTLWFNFSFLAVIVIVHKILGGSYLWSLIGGGVYLLIVNMMWQAIIGVRMTILLSKAGVIAAMVKFIFTKNNSRAMHGINVTPAELEQKSEYILRSSCWPLVFVPGLMAICSIVVSLFSGNYMIGLNIIIFTHLLGGVVSVYLVKVGAIGPLPIGFGDGYDSW